MSGRNEHGAIGTVCYRPAANRSKPFVACGPVERDTLRRESLGRYATSAQAWHAVRCNVLLTNPARDPLDPLAVLVPKIRADFAACGWVSARHTAATRRAA